MNGVCDIANVCVCITYVGDVRVVSGNVCVGGSISDVGDVAGVVVFVGRWCVNDVACLDQCVAVVGVSCCYYAHHGWC